MAIILKRTGYIMLSAIIIIIIGLGTMGQISQNKENLETYLLSEQVLGTCPDKPNCVSSFIEKSNSHYLGPHPLKIEQTAEIRPYFLEKCNLQRETAVYWYFTCKSSVFGFVDDVEILFKNEKLFFRSASRVGHSDMGANRKRIDKFKKFLEKFH